ncbi:hypothetical protein JCM21900_003716 [Sporobolomyces salmonicolor]
MLSRLASSTRLAARFAQTGLQSRVQAAKVLARAPSSSRVESHIRLFTSSRSFLDDAKTPSTPSDVTARAAEDSSASAAPTPSPAPVDQPTTDLPVEETPVQSVSLDASASTGATAVHVSEDPEELTKRTVFVGGLSWNVDNQWLEDEVLKGLDVEEGVSAVRIARDHLGKSKGFAFVELATPELANQLAGLTLDIDGRTSEFRISTSSPPRSPRASRSDGASRQSGPRNPPSSTIWIGNLAWSVDEASVEEVFSRFGEIKRVSLPKDVETGRSRGIGYVEYEDVDTASGAFEHVQNEGMEIDGRAIRVDFASSEQRGPRRSQSGGGGQRGGRGGYNRDGGRGGSNSRGGFNDRGGQQRFRGGNEW